MLRVPADSQERTDVVKSLRLTVLVEDSVDPSRKDVKAKHGLPIKAEVEREGKWFSFLADTGLAAELVLHNAGNLNVDLKKTKAIFISHGHYDHKGDLVGVLKHIARETPLIAHPRVFEHKMNLKPVLTYIGSPHRRSQLKASGGLVLLSRNPPPLMEGVSTSGEIERVTKYEEMKGFWTISRERFHKRHLGRRSVIGIEGQREGLSRSLWLGSRRHRQHSRALQEGDGCREDLRFSWWAPSSRGRLGKNPANRQETPASRS